MNLRDRANQASVTEAAEMFGIDSCTVHQAIKRGKLPAKRKWWRNALGHKRHMWVVDLSEVEAWRDAVANRYRPESTDEHELARIRGIKRRSARRALLRWNARRVA